MVKAIIVGVSNYKDPSKNLPLCRNDIYAIKKALVTGLNVDQNDIIICGETGSVMIRDLFSAFGDTEKTISTSDTFIFYFSGHGAKNSDKNYLVLSDNYINIDGVIGYIDNIKCKNKIIMLDCCCAGKKSENLDTVININETADQFVGRGCAVMASCDLNEGSGFNGTLSRYTQILCNALTARPLIRRGKKSLEDIKAYVDRLVNIDNRGSSNKQHNAFRSNIIGTIYFDVESYTPYEQKKIYMETDKYIVYAVEPLHHGNVKRISLKVILRLPCSEQELATIANEIKDEAIHYEVYNNEIS